jgi:hypothetical protein
MSSDRNAPVLRAYLLLGHLLFFGLFALAYLHMPTRVVHVDSAFQIFKWIHVPGVGVEAHRFTAVMPQLLVKAVAITGAPLHVLLTVASLAHVLVPYVLFVLIAHGLRLPWIALGSGAVAGALHTPHLLRHRAGGELPAELSLLARGPGLRALDAFA